MTLLMRDNFSSQISSLSTVEAEIQLKYNISLCHC